MHHAIILPSAALMSVLALLALPVLGMAFGASRAYVDEVAAGLLDFAIARASSLSDATKSLLLTLRGDQTGDDTHEEVEDCEVFGHAAIDWRPADPDPDDGCEVLIWRRGDELVGLATKDRRWQVQVEAGEVAIHAFGDDTPTILLKPSGEVVITAPGDVSITSDGNVGVTASSGEVVITSPNVEAGGDRELCEYVDLNAHLTAISTGLNALAARLAPLDSNPPIEVNYGAAAKAVLDLASPIKTTITKGT